MPRRALAAWVIVTLLAWLATPAFATARCRITGAICPLCARANGKPASRPAVKNECCIVKPGAEHPVVDSLPGSPHLVLSKAVDQRLPELAFAIARASDAPVPSESPPFEKQNPPLLR